MADVLCYVHCLVYKNFIASTLSQNLEIFNTQFNIIITSNNVSCK